MNNFRNNRKNRFKSNGERNFRKRPLSGSRNISEFSNSDFRHKNPGRNNQNAAKLVDKYNNLAREALSSGDKILSENYFQHADHFTRILNDQDAQKKLNSTNNDVANSSQNIVDVKKDQNESDENKTITQIK